MRKLKTGPAITGGIFCILKILLTMISVLSLVISYISYPSGYMGPSIFISNAVDIILLVLLTIVLFSRKKNVFAGIVLGVTGLYLAIGAVSSIATFEVTGVCFALSACGRLVISLLLILMAVDCFANLKFSPSLKKSLYGGLVLIAALFWAVMYALYYTRFFGSLEYMETFEIVTTIFTVGFAVINGGFTYIAYACAGFAVAGATEPPVFRPQPTPVPVAGQPDQAPVVPQPQNRLQQNIDWYGYQNQDNQN